MNNINYLRNHSEKGNLKLTNFFIFFSVLPFYFFTALPTKGEDSYCYYSTKEEYEKCFGKVNEEKKPRYPLAIKYARLSARNVRYMMWVASPYSGESGTGFVGIPLESKGSLVQLKSKDGKEIEIVKGRWGPWYNEFVSVSSQIIPSENIVGWKKYNLNTANPRFQVKYLDQFLNEKQFEFQLNGYSKPPRKGTLIQDFFVNITQSKSGQFKTAESILENKLNKLQRQSEIIGGIISISDSAQKNCLKVDEEKYPDLVQKYKKMVASINPLRKKMNLGATRTVRPLCN